MTIAAQTEPCQWQQRRRRDHRTSQRLPSTTTLSPRQQHKKQHNPRPEHQAWRRQQHNILTRGESRSTPCQLRCLQPPQKEFSAIVHHRLLPTAHTTPPDTTRKNQNNDTWLFILNRPRSKQTAVHTVVRHNSRRTEIIYGGWSRFRGGFVKRYKKMEKGFCVAWKFLFSILHHLCELPSPEAPNP